MTIHTQLFCRRTDWIWKNFQWCILACRAQSTNNRHHKTNVSSSKSAEYLGLKNSQFRQNRIFQYTLYQQKCYCVNVPTVGVCGTRQSGLTGPSTAFSSKKIVTLSFLSFIHGVRCLAATLIIDCHDEPIKTSWFRIKKSYLRIVVDTVAFICSQIATDWNYFLSLSSAFVQFQRIVLTDFLSVLTKHRYLDFLLFQFQHNLFSQLSVFFDKWN